MYPILVLEGADCSGKTTLAKAILSHGDIAYLHLSYRYPTAMFQYQLAAVMRAVKEARHRPVVIDRLWMSEAVYAKVYRGGSPWPEMGRMLDRILQRYGALYIMCVRDDTEEHLRHFAETAKLRHEMYSDISGVVSEYHSLLNGLLDSYLDSRDGYYNLLCYNGVKDRDDVIVYDMEDYTTESSINDFARLALSYQNLFSYYGEVVNDIQSSKSKRFAGNFRRSKVLFIGSAPTRYRDCHYPFVSNNDDSVMFAKVLTELGIHESTISFADPRTDEERSLLNRYIWSNRNDRQGYLIIVQVGEPIDKNTIEADYRIKSPTALRGIHRGSDILATKLIPIFEKAGLYHD